MRKRRGFTLIELMVVMAIILIIMVILSRAFGDGLTVLRKAKGIGDMQDKLRAVTGQLRRDLTADHFDGRRRVSDWQYDWSWQGPPYNTGNLPPPPRRVALSATPREGLFTVSPLPFVNEGTDSDGLASRRTSAIGTPLRFTVKLRGNEPKNFFSAKIPPGSPLGNPSLQPGSTYVGLPSDARFQDPNSQDTYNSQWADVRYYLKDLGKYSGSVTQDDYRAGLSASGQVVPLYALYRAQAVLVSDNTGLNALNLPANAASQIQYAEFSTGVGTNGRLHFNTPVDIAQNKASSVNSIGSGGNPAWPDGALLLNDVISFEVILLNRETWAYWGNNNYSSTGASIRAHKPDMTSTGSPNPYNPLANPSVQSQQQNADYWTSGPVTGTWAVPVDCIRITIRVWDRNTEQARQITIFQDM
jgi:prepilin-type N-terminal cleavage/methylation domain-containing protein